MDSVSISRNILILLFTFFTTSSHSIRPLHQRPTPYTSTLQLQNSTFNNKVHTAVKLNGQKPFLQANFRSRLRKLDQFLSPREGYRRQILPRSHIPRALPWFPKPGRPDVQQRTSEDTGKTFDTCTTNEDCRGNRECIALGTDDEECVPGVVCGCLPEALVYCASNSDCENGEVCAKTILDIRTVCVSERQERIAPFFERISRGNADLSGRLSFDRCDGNGPCDGSRECTAINSGGNLIRCGRTGTCLCIETSLAPCFSNDGCTTNEVCADVPPLPFSVCASSRQAMNHIGVVEVVRPPSSNGFSLDPCRDDTVCVGDRVCMLFGLDGVRGRCDGSSNCACIFPSFRRRRCEFTSTCRNEREVCATTPFFNSPICTSIDAREAHSQIFQVNNLADCPVRIDNDEPTSTFDFQRSGNRPSNRYSSNEDDEPHTGTNVEDNEDLDSTERIVGGLFSPPNIVRFMVSLSNSNLTSLCTGTLISPKWVLTAAHCQLRRGDVASFNGTQAFLDVPAGTRRRMPWQGVPVRIKRVLVHPRYDPADLSGRLDLAAVELEEPPPLGSGFMQLNDRMDEPKDNDVVRAIGFGLTSFNNELNGPRPFALRQVDLYVSEFDFCRDAALALGVIVQEGQTICIGSRRERCGTCSGDSGGPIIKYDERRRPTILAVTSAGAGCGEPEIPSLTAPISKGLRWLRESGVVFYTKQGVFNDNPGACQPGEFVLRYLREVRFCHPCPSTSRSMGGSVTECSPCPNGQVRDLNDGSRCVSAGRRL